MIGVDLDEELNWCAKENIRKAAGRFRAKEVTSVVANVLEWPVPDDLSVVFMFNPFMGQTFRGAMERILDSYDRKLRDLRIIYGFPAGARLAGIYRSCGRRECSVLFLATASRLVAAG